MGLHIAIDLMEIHGDGYLGSQLLSRVFVFPKPAVLHCVCGSEPVAAGFSMTGVIACFAVWVFLLPGDVESASSCNSSDQVQLLQSFKGVQRDLCSAYQKLWLANFWWCSFLLPCQTKVFWESFFMYFSAS